LTRQHKKQKGQENKETQGKKDNLNRLRNTLKTHNTKSIKQPNNKILLVVFGCFIIQSVISLFSLSSDELALETVAVEFVSVESLELDAAGIVAHIERLLLEQKRTNDRLTNRHLRIQNKREIKNTKEQWQPAL
jgi:hypothetical protein